MVNDGGRAAGVEAKSEADQGYKENVLFHRFTRHLLDACEKVLATRTVCRI
jgi:hypothetical protein